jgi:lysophospholipase L1-like esterase
MKLTNEQIHSLALGVAETLSDKDGIELYRMKKAQAQRVVDFNADFGKKAYATAGIRLDFYTDSKFFAFSYDKAVAASSRKWYYFSLLVNDEQVALIGEEQATSRLGSYRVELPDGKNRITLFLPNLFRARITSVELSDGAFFERVTPKRRLLFHGDSITQGYDSKAPHLSYANRVACALDAEIFNFAIGGAMFNMRMVDTSTDYNADAVVVAYGSNDWYKREDMQTFSKNCLEFFEKLMSLHKDVPVFVILPIWRFNFAEQRPVGAFQTARAEIARIASGYQNTQIIDMFDVVPHELFSDGLHPIDDGFAYYAQSVLKQIKI